MSKSNIQWTGDTWNPVCGCSPVCKECDNCYAAKDAYRMSFSPNERISAAYRGSVRKRADGSAAWTGDVRLLPERLLEPLRLTKPQMIFVNSMSDLFHESLDLEDIQAVVRIMMAADWRC